MEAKGAKYKDYFDWQESVSSAPSHRILAMLRGEKEDLLNLSVVPAEEDALAFARANHALNLGTPGRTRLVDWRDPPAELTAELVLAADVLYERRFLGPLLDTLERALHPGGTALVAEPGRTVAEGTVELLEQRGLRRELHLVEVTAGGREHGVWIHELHRPLAGN